MGPFEGHQTGVTGNTTDTNQANKAEIIANKRKGTD